MKSNAYCAETNVNKILHRLVKCLKEQGIEINDPIKYSHERKTLYKHVEECWEFADKLLSKFKIPDEIKKLCYFLCITHDLGKLDPKWKIGKTRKEKIKISHSRKSFEYTKTLLENSPTMIPLSQDYQPILLFSVLTHHTSLDVKKIVDIPKLWQRMRSFLKKKDKRTIMGISDMIGIFKLADIISASNLSQDFFSKVILQQYTWLEEFEEKIKKGIISKAKNKRGLFDKKKYKVQSEIARTKSKHLAIIAPTGWGKTALALLRAKEIKPKKIFYCLPTITAIKGFENDLKNIFGSESVGEYFYFADVEYFKQEDTSETAYPIDFYRYFIPKITITTIDQILMTAIQLGKYHLRRFNFRDALMIFDEFHLLTTEMIGILKAVLELLADIYNFSVLLMTATPSELYLKELGECLKNQGGFSCKKMYQEYKHLRRHKIKDCNDEILDFIQENSDLFKSKKRILVIANTVERAVKAYNIIRSLCSSDAIELIHSRFTYRDRAEKEKKIEKTKILVSTQVAEVSLDVSFDILITELAPFPALIQRLGRVNRYSKEYANREPNVYICHVPNNKPYMRIEIYETRRLLPRLVDEIEKTGEATYLDILDEYEEVLEAREKIKELYNQTLTHFDNTKYFYSLVMKEESFQKYFGREVNYMAVPPLYCDNIKKLERKLQEEKSYKKKRKILAQIKEFFVPTPYYIKLYWNEELHCHIISDENYIYDEVRGLVKHETLEYSK